MLPMSCGSVPTDHSMEEPVDQGEEHRLSLPPDRRSDPTKALLTAVIAGFCAPHAPSSPCGPTDCPVELRHGLGTQISRSRPSRSAMIRPKALTTGSGRIMTD